MSKHKKLIKPKYSKGLFKYVFLFLVSMIALEGLSLAFPVLLARVTTVTEEVKESGGSVMPLVWQGLLVLGFIILIFGVYFWSEYAGAAYSDRYQANVRKVLFNKFSELSGEQIDQLGTARVLPTITNDSNWLKLYNNRIVRTIIYFPVRIVGSLIMLFTLGWEYAVFALASIPFIIVFSVLCIKRMGKFIPDSVDGFDEYFMNIKEGIKGAKDIRILGKADERSAEFEGFVRANRRQGLATDRGIALSTGFHAILFSLITIAVVIYGAILHLEPGQMAGIVALNTAIQYINSIWTGSHTIFTWFVDNIPRCNYTYKRLHDFYSMPGQPKPTGTTDIPVYKKNYLHLRGVCYRMDLKNIDIDINEGTRVAITGGIGSGKSILSEMLIKLKTPSDGTILFNDIDIANINATTWRRDFVSYCNNSPQFIPGTVRDNFKLLAPTATDEQMLAAFGELGAENFVEHFSENILDFDIKEGSPLPEGTKNVLNIVRSILKPAGLYIFNQCFEHVRPAYITRLMAKLKREKKTAIFITFNGFVCKNCNSIYVLKQGSIIGSGTHSELMKSNAEYRKFHTSMHGVMVIDEQVETEGGKA